MPKFVSKPEVCPNIYIISTSLEMEYVKIKGGAETLKANNENDYKLNNGATLTTFRTICELAVND